MQFGLLFLDLVFCSLHVLCYEQKITMSFFFCVQFDCSYCSLNQTPESYVLYSSGCAGS